MKLIDTATINLGSASILEQLALYNGMDNLSVLEILPRLRSELTPTKLATYAFEMDLQAPLLEMSLNGIDVDHGERARMISEYEVEQAKVGSILHSFCEAIGYYDYYLQIALLRYSDAIGEAINILPRSWPEWLAFPLTTRREWKARAVGATFDFHKALKESSVPFNGNSSDQKLQLFYHFFGHYDNTITHEKFPDFLPPWNKAHGVSEYRSRNTENEYVPSTDRDSLEKILKSAPSDPSFAAYWATPFVNCCLALADISKTLGFLRCRLEDSKFKSSYGAVTETGRLSSKQNAQGFGSNAQNVAPKLRRIFTCKPGWKMATPDYEQIESRNVGAICYTLFGATAYLNATESGDLHSLACSMVWDDLPWPADFNLSWLEKHGPFPADMIRAAKKIAGVPFYRGKSRRDVSKTLGHGSNYLGQPPHMAKQSHIDLGLVQHYQVVYFGAFPEVKLWHNYVIEQVQTKGEITTLLGRTRQFFGRPSDDATIREAVAFEPQSIAADYTNTALLNLHKAVLRDNLPIVIFLQKHDEIGFRYLETDEALVLPIARDIMVQSRTIVSPSGAARQWSVPVEMQCGWNLGKYKPIGSEGRPNPDGIREWKGSDDRTRTENPFDLTSFLL